MAQIPTGRLVKGQYKPICKDCAMYFSPTVPPEVSKFRPPKKGNHFQKGKIGSDLPVPSVFFIGIFVSFRGVNRLSVNFYDSPSRDPKPRTLRDCAAMVFADRFRPWRGVEDAVCKMWQMFEAIFWTG